MKKLTFIFLTLLLLTTPIFAWDGGRISFTFHNDTSYTVVYYLYWVDHTLDRSQFPGPVNLAAGELKPGGDEDVLQNAYRPGKYIIEWRVIRGGQRASIAYGVQLMEGLESVRLRPLFGIDGGHVKKLSGKAWQVSPVVD